MGTLLTDPVAPEVEAEMLRRDEVIGKARIIVFGIWLEGYREGRISLESLCERAGKAVAKINKLHQQRILGEMLYEALRIEPKTITARRKGEPEKLQEAASKIVDLVFQYEKLPMTRGSKKKLTAFERTAQIFEELGVTVSDTQIFSWHYGKNKKKR